MASEGGFESLSFGELAQRTQLSKSGLFAHFASRDDLQFQILEQADRLFRHEVVEVAQGVPPGLPRLRTLFSRWIGWASRAGLPGGCPFVALAVEVDDAQGPLRDRLVVWQDGWFAYMCSLVLEARELNHLPQAVDARQFVWELSGVYLIYHHASRLARDHNAESRALTALERLIRFPPQLS